MCGSSTLAARDQRETRSPDSGAWNEAVVALAVTFPREKVIVAAVPGVWIAPANGRARRIDRALACFLIEEFADVLEDVVLLMPENAAHRRILGIAQLGLFVRDAEVASDAKQIPLAYFDSIVAATIGWAFRAVIKNRKLSRLLARTPITVDTHSHSLVLQSTTFECRASTDR
jgi:hypothetical protein